jgi:signal peptidase I
MTDESLSEQQRVGQETPPVLPDLPNVPGTHSSAQQMVEMRERGPIGHPSPELSEKHLSVGRFVARGLRGLLETIAPAIIIALVINLFLAQATRVYGQSMEPNLHSDQRLVIEKLSYSHWLRLRSQQRGDVVVVLVEGSSDLLIKRVVGLPGDQVEIRDGQVLVNHEPLTEPYVAQPTYGSYGPMDVPPLHLFVMGDNRNFSNDSRTFGPVPMKDVVGRAWLSYWPPDQWGLVQ